MKRAAVIAMILLVALFSVAIVGVAINPERRDPRCDTMARYEAMSQGKDCNVY